MTDIPSISELSSEAPRWPARDYHTGLGPGGDWAVYFVDGKITDDDMPIAVFAKRGDAREFKRMKEVRR